MSKIGFIGLGIMGAPMAGHLLAGGHELYLYDVKSVAKRLVDQGGIPCGSSKNVAQKADIVVIMVPDTPNVEEVRLAEDGVAVGLSPGKIVVDMSSISPIETKAFARKIEALGCNDLDAPVSGGEVGAKAASLTIMVGGKPEVFDRVKPLFELMGKNITLVGDTGAGQTCKVANQIIVALTIEAVGEALLFASKAGADPAKVRQALMGGFASSRILEVHGERMIKRTFNPGFRIALHQKDLNLALSSARALGVSLPNTATCQELFNACAAHAGSAWEELLLRSDLEMKLVLSRKGFDGQSGGVASPILPDGRVISLPIPSMTDNFTFADLNVPDVDLGGMIPDLSRRQHAAGDPIHLDPDLDRPAGDRLPGWRPALGQTGAAQTHLLNNAVGPGDVFLFFGWFRRVELHHGRWRYVPRAPDLHVMFGWIEVEAVISVVGMRRNAALAEFPWVADHPHVATPAACGEVKWIEKI